MSDKLQEINNLAQELTQNPQRLIQIGHECFEQVDKDTIKQLCVSCGGKGFYLLIQGFPDSKLKTRQGEIMPCDCEDGFKYSKMLEKDYGSS